METLITVSGFLRVSNCNHWVHYSRWPPGEWVAEEGPSVIQGRRESPLYYIAQGEGSLGPPVHNVLQGENT